MSFTIVETEDAPTITFMKSLGENNHEEKKIEKKLQQLQVLENEYTTKIESISDIIKRKELASQIENDRKDLEKINRYLLDNIELSDNDILELHNRIAPMLMAHLSVEELRVKLVSNLNLWKKKIIIQRLKTL